MSRRPSSPDALTPDALQARLRGRRPRRISRVVAPRRAAVAAILRPGEQGPEILLMRRIARDGDRWSGQISMPGGMASDGDRDSQHTARRETLEEVGLDLALHAAVLGRSDDQVAIAKGRPLPMAITPWVFALHGDATLSLGDEAEEAFWLPTGPLLRGELDDVVHYDFAGMRQELPAWRFEDRVIWGLTHRMLSRLFELAARR